MGDLMRHDVIEHEGRREDQLLRVWRQGFMVYHSAMDPTEARAMTQLVAGAPFATICEAIADGTSMEEAAPKAVGWLARWIEDGILAGPLAL